LRDGVRRQRYPQNVIERAVITSPPAKAGVGSIEQALEMIQAGANAGGK
jgi:hypothetical protein